MKELAEGVGPIELVVSPYCKPLLPFLEIQPFLDRVLVDQNWEVEFSAPVRPWKSPSYPNAIHLGMREWPSPTLVEYYPKLLREEYGFVLTVDPERPWLTVGELPVIDTDPRVTMQFSDEWVEVKYAWVAALNEAVKGWPGKAYWTALFLGYRDGRLWRDFGQVPAAPKYGVLDLARSMAQPNGIALVCNSMGHPLASGLGTPAVVADPSPARNQAVFRAPIARNKYLAPVGGFTVNSFEVVGAVKELLEGRLKDG